MKSRFLFLLFAISLITCTPKVVEKTVETPKEPVTAATDEKAEDLSPCVNWLKASNQDELMSAHVLYKDKLREIRSMTKNDAIGNASRIDAAYKEGLELWKIAYEAAPAADGKRPDHFDDGIKFYEHKYNVSQNASDKENAVTEVMKIYEARAECYGDKAYMMGAKAFDYYYKYGDMKTEEEKYALFKEAMDVYQDSADYFILNPFTAILSNMIIAEKIPLDEAQKYAGWIRSSLENGLNGAKSAKAKEPWLVVNDYVPARLDQFEGIRGFYDCNYYKEKYLKDWQADPTNCEAINRIIGKMKWGGCTDTDADLMAARSAKNTHCRVIVEPVAQSCRSKLQDGDYKGAIGCYEEKAQGFTDPMKRAQYNLVIAKIYYGELKRFGEARKYARMAIKDRPNWGDPYLLIGKLYASSGPLCGPGRGFDSQRVTWPAIDKWNKAKSVDPSVAAEANKLIRQYTKYMPSTEDLFQRSLKTGDSYKVPCWIQETTKIRAAPRG